jgi:putative ABC transport system permease protein
MIRDFRLALRLAARRPILSGAIIATLALGIGATTAVFGIVRAVLSQSAPFRDAERLAILWLSEPTRSEPFVEVSYPDFLDWRRDASDIFESLAAVPPVNFEATLSGHGEPRQVRGRAVTTNFFDVLGAAPAFGRTFLTSEEPAGASRVVVLGHGLWQELFGGGPAAVGRTLTLDGNVHTIVGIMPRAFQYPSGAQYWIPIEPAVPSNAITGRNIYWLIVVGRLRGAVTLDTARAAMDVVVRRLDRRHLNEEDRRIVAGPLTEHILGGIRRPLVALFAAVILLLLVGCTNIAGLLLTRSTERRREIAVRTALGASRMRLARQSLIEIMPVALGGAAAGFVLSFWIVQFLVSGRGLELPSGVEVATDYAALGVAVALSLVTAAVGALAPAVDAAAIGHPSLGERLRETPGVGGGRHARGRDMLLVAELTLAVVLVAGAMLLGRSFLALAGSDFGFDARRVLTLEVPQERSVEQARSFYAQALERIRALPGVRSAAGVFLRPLWSTIGFDGIYVAEGQTDADGETNPHVNVEGVTPVYFETMRIRLVSGRDFTDADGEGTSGRIIVSQSLARRAWPDTEALGKRLRMPLGSDSPYHQKWLTVVGVAANVRYRETELARFDLYLPYRQFNAKLKHLVVRADGDPAELVPSIKAVIRAIDPAQPIDDVQTMGAIVDGALRTRRVTAQIFVGLAATALFVALLGVHAMMAHSVTLIRRELAVRLALGAEPRRIRRAILVRGLRLASLAIVPGLGAALLLGRGVAGLLYEVAPTDLPTLVAAAAAVGLVGLAGCYVPALRASRTDPIAALRQE